MPDIVYEMLQEIPFFSGLNKKDYRMIFQSFTFLYLPEKYLLFSVGDKGNTFYIIRSGKIEAFLPDPETKKEKRLAILKKNDFFGEIALLHPKSRRTASIRTLEKSQIFELERERFEALLLQRKDLGTKILSTLQKRIEENRKKGVYIEI